jgi:hypothetical protein
MNSNNHIYPVGLELSRDGIPLHFLHTEGLVQWIAAQCTRKQAMAIGREFIGDIVGCVVHDKCAVPGHHFIDRAVSPATTL